MLRLGFRVAEGSMDSSGTLYQLILAPNWLHYSMALFAASLAVIWAVSSFTTKPTPEMLQGLTYGYATPEQVAETRSSWNQWDVIHSGLILAIIVVFYIYFW